MTDGEIEMEEKEKGNGCVTSSWVANRDGEQYSAPGTRFPSLSIESMDSHP